MITGLICPYCSIEAARGISDPLFIILVCAYRSSRCAISISSTSIVSILAGLISVRNAGSMPLIAQSPRKALRML